MAIIGTFSVKKADEEVFNSFKKMTLGSNSSRIMEAIKFYYAHKRGHNGDKITSFVDNLIRTPDIFAGKEEWEKYVNEIKTNDEYKRIDDQLNMIVRIFNKRFNELSKGI